jgi:hypothetical protein
VKWNAEAAAGARSHALVPCAIANVAPDVAITETTVPHGWIIGYFATLKPRLICAVGY